MRARLFARFGPEAGLDVEFGDEATIGRGRDNSVPLSSREVSQQHARVFFDAESAAYWLEDLGSLNGTRLDGEPVSGRAPLGALHVLSFGAAAELFFLELDRGPEKPEEPETAALETTGRRTRIDAEAPILPAGLQAKRADAAAAGKPGSTTRVEESPAGLPPSLAGGHAAPVPAAAGRFGLEILGSPGGRFELHEGDNLLGRSGRARVVVANRVLSRRHAVLRVEGDRVWLRDEGSRNHTFVGGEEISGEVEIEPASELRFGRLEARLYLTGPVAGEEEPE